MAKELFDRPLLFLDGGLGTTLEEEHGIHFSSATPLWSSHLLVSSPPTLLKAQTDFARAGADVLLTATYQASFEGFSRTPRETPLHDRIDCDVGYNRMEAANYMRSAVTITRTAFRDAERPDGLVALSLGAYGATMSPSQEYTGKYPKEFSDVKGLYKFHLDRITCFAEDETTWNNVDLVAFETLPRLAEVEAVRMVMEAIKTTTASKDFWISCVFPNDDELPDGSTISQIVEAMLSDSGDRPAARPFAIGVNCTKVHRFSNLIQEFESAAKEQSLSLPRLIIYPDGASGLVYDTATQKWVLEAHPENKDTSNCRPWPEEVVGIVRAVRVRGAWQGVLAGGCCKTTPVHIAALRNALE